MRILQMIWGILLIGFFVSTLTLSLPLGNELFVSPDENAAFVFARQFAESGSFALHEPLNEVLHGRLHPRSAIGYGNAILPASFLGHLLLLGSVGAVFGSVGMYFVTPVLAVLAVLLWRSVAHRLLNDRLIANAAAFFLLIHPAFWYYTGRVMMHNVAFLTFLIASVWFAIVQPWSARATKERRASARLVDFGCGGLMLGIALMIRTYEVIWITFALAALFGFYRRLLGWRAMTAFVSGVAIMLMVLAGVQAVTYGSPFTSGYNAHYVYEQPVTESPDTTLLEEEQPDRVNIFLPFGFHERVILSNIANYGFKLYPWMSLLALAGIGLVFVEKDSRQHIWRALLVLTFVLAVWMGIVYGSWKIIDNPDPNIISLGNSHVRYWLPLFALASLFAARAFRSILGGGGSLPTKSVESYLRIAFAGTLVVLMTLLSANLVFFGEDGFIPSRIALRTFREKRTQILEHTEDESIIVVDRADKYLFPHRRVVVPLRDESTYAALPAMTERVPVYYFGITFPESDITYLNTLKLPPLGLRIEYVDTFQEESLYRFVRVEE